MIDKNVGRILKELENKGLLEDSIIIFTSDHGEFLGDHWLLTKGCSDYDCIIKVPFILYYPEKLPSGLSINSFTQEIDIFPTLCELIGVPIPSTVQGKSLLPLIEGSSKEIYEEILVETGPTIRTKEWRMTVREDGYSELYNLKDDPNQFFNLWYDDKYWKVKEKLMQRLIMRMKEALPVPKPEAIW